jgi:ferredoxin
MGDQWSVSDLKAWTKGLLGSYRVVAPVAGPNGPVWDEIQDAEDIVWDYGRTAASPRAWLLPRSETLFRYDVGANPPEIVEAEVQARPTILLLLRPCDVAGLRALDAVMRWDYSDEPFEARRKATLFAALGCDVPASPDACFCEAAGIDPHWATGADVMISRVDASGGVSYRVASLTDRGKEILSGAPAELSTVKPESKPIGTAAVDIEQARAWMRSHFDDPEWQKVTEACLGCGTCAFVCPSCHCFDIVDEGDWRRGERVRFWDSCAFDNFTQHASGHNPRARQSSRWRQRIYHKFVYYPDKFGRLLCTGCGRCVDACPAGMDLIEILQGVAGKEGVAK